MRIFGIQGSVAGTIEMVILFGTPGIDQAKKLTYATMVRRLIKEMPQLASAMAATVFRGRHKHERVGQLPQGYAAAVMNSSKN